MKNFTLTELAEYYLDRYGIAKSHKEMQIRISKALRQKLIRLLQNVKFEECSFYAIMEKKNENGNKEELKRPPRIISVALFEKFCFEDWIKYISKVYHDKIENIKNWEIDLKRLRNERAIETRYPNEAYNNLDDEVLKKGREMMIDAIFYKFFVDFRWEDLQCDWEQANGQLECSPKIFERYVIEK